MTIKAGEILTIRFPFSDFSQAKLRPVLALSAADQNRDFICLAITSKKNQTDATEINSEDLQTGKLPKTSYIRLNKIFTLHESLAEQTVGAVNKEKMQIVMNQVCQNIGCHTDKIN